MSRALALALGALVLWTAQPAAAGCPESVEAEVQAALDRFLLDGFNTRDPMVWAGTLSYPHCRIGGVGTSVWRTANEYADAVDFPGQLAMGWDHSEWASKKVLWCSHDAAFARVHYLRKRTDGSILHSLHGVYTLTRQEDGWGVLARFSGMVAAEDGGARAAAEAAAAGALEAHLAAAVSGNLDRVAGSLRYPFLSLVDEQAVVVASSEEARRGFVSCEGRGTMKPLLEAGGAVIFGLGLEGDTGRPPAVYVVTMQDGGWGVRGCASFTEAR